MPHLQLKLMSEPVAGQNNDCRFTEQGGSIGRAEECDWTLVDNDRFISKKHLVVTFENQQFILTDMSSNGVFVNKSKTPLGKDNQHVLKLSDKLTLGKHIIVVEQIELSTKIPSPPFSSQEIDNSGLFGLVSGGSEAKPKPEIDSPPDIPEIINKQADLPESNLGLNEIISTPIPSTINNNPAASQTSQSVEPQNAQNSLIPDDYELSELVSKVENIPAQKQSASIIPALPKEEQLVTPEDNSLVGAYQPPVPTPIVVMPEPVEPADSENALPQEPKPSNNVPSKDTFFNAFYEKLGLPKEYMENVDPEVFADDIVDILLSSTSGLMSLLSSRLLFKHEARLAATLIQAKSNNPIKFSIDPVDTLEMLLLKKKKGYMSAKDSYDEAINDIQLHQTAFLCGLQASLVGVLSELSPEKIEKEIADKTPRFMGLNSNSQCWQLYKEQQPALLSSVNENFNDILGIYFSDAYQAQINNLKNKY